MLYDALSWVLSVEPPAPSAVSLSFTVCISISSEDHFYPHSLYIAVPATSLPLQLFTLSSPFFIFSHSVCPLHVLWVHFFVL